MLLAAQLPTIMVDNSYASLIISFAGISLLMANSSWMDIIRRGKFAEGVGAVDTLISFACGLVFGGGLIVSGMCNPLKVTRFLDFSGPEGFDPSLAGVMGGGVLLNIITYKLMHANKLRVVFPPTTAASAAAAGPKGVTLGLDQVIKLGTHADNMSIDPRLVLGSALFGIGWGIGGTSRVSR